MTGAGTGAGTGIAAQAANSPAQAADAPVQAANSPVRVYVPRDSAARSVGADKVAEAIRQAAGERGRPVELVRDGSRGMLWLEPLVEVVTPEGRIGYGPVAPEDVAGLLDAGLLDGAGHPLRLGVVDELPWLARQNRVTFARVGVVDPLSPEDYVRHGGATVSVEVDGLPVTVPEGTSVMRAAAQAGIDIPKLCATDSVEPFGSCRLCVVEIDGRRGTPASCTTPCAEGMVVRTRTPKVEKLRQGVMELYISDHPLDCPTCSANGDCELQDMAGAVGLRQVRYGYEGENHLDAAPDLSNPYFDFDPSKCIACSRCVRACGEVQGAFALTIEGRGFDSKVSPGAGESFMDSECVSCGACVQACPTATLQERSVVELGMPSRSVITTCAYRGVGCSFKAELRGDELVRMVPYKDGGANEGHSCVKGRFAFAYATHPDRKLRPMDREKTTDPWREVGWDEAIRTVATRMRAIQVAHVVVTEGLVDGAFVAARCEGFDEWAEFVALPENSPEATEPVAGVPAGELRAAARLYAQAPNGAVYYGLGVTEHSQGSTMVMGMANLAMACGNIGRDGVGVNPLRGQNNVQGSCDMGSFPYEFSGYRHVSDDAVRGVFEELWGRSLLPEPGLRIPNMFDAAIEGSFRGLFVHGEDIAQSDPNLRHVSTALSAMDLVVLQDLFLNETAKFTHVFLPGASFLEKDGTFTNAERRVNRVRAVMKPKTGKHEWQIVCEIATAMGYPMAYDHPGQIMDEIAQVTPTFKGISFGVLDKLGSVQWPCDDEAPEGTPTMHVDAFVRGRGRFVVTAHVPTDERTTSRFPLVLTTGRILSQYNVGAQTRRTGNVAWHPEDVLELHPLDAENRGVTDGDMVTLASRVGRTTLRARVSDRMPPGVVHTTFHHPVTGANVVTTENSDWATNCPEYKVTASRSPSRTRSGGTPPSRHRPTCSRGWTEMAGAVPPEQRMANQIAANLGHVPGDRAAEALAGHVGRFWDPRMRGRLFELVEAGAEGLDPVVVAAVRLLRQPGQAPAG